MRKTTGVTAFLLAACLVSVDTPAIDVSKLFAGQPSRALEAFGGSFDRTAPQANGIIPVPGNGDYYICKKSPDVSGLGITLRGEGSCRIFFAAIEPETQQGILIKTVLQVMKP